MRPLSAKDTIAVLKKNGFVLSRQQGSHMIFKNYSTGTIVPMPVHGKNKPIPIGTFLAIVKQSQIPSKYFAVRRV